MSKTVARAEKFVALAKVAVQVTAKACKQTITTVALVATNAPVRRNVLQVNVSQQSQLVAVEP